MGPYSSRHLVQEPCQGSSHKWRPHRKKHSQRLKPCCMHCPYETHSSSELPQSNLPLGGSRASAFAIIPEGDLRSDACTVAGQRLSRLPASRSFLISTEIHSSPKIRRNRCHVTHAARIWWPSLAVNLAPVWRGGLFASCHQALLTERYQGRLALQRWRALFSAEQFPGRCAGLRNADSLREWQGAQGPRAQEGICVREGDFLLFRLLRPWSAKASRTAKPC